MPAHEISVIQGEIHNVLSTLRQQQQLHKKSNICETLIFDFQNLKDRLHHIFNRPLSAAISSTENNAVGTNQQRIMRSSLSFSNNSAMDILDVVTFIKPFVEAVMINRDLTMSHSIIGAALSSLYKFLLYNFITPSSPLAYEGITLIAKCLIQCEALGSLNSRRKRKGRSRTKNQRQEEEAEEVVMKLVSLAALVIRCEVAALLRPKDVYQLMIVCLRVSLNEEVSGLLRSSAADSLAHIVLVVTGRDLKDDDKEGEECMNLNSREHQTSSGEQQQSGESQIESSENNNSEDQHLVPTEVVVEEDDVSLSPPALVLIIRRLATLLDPKVNDDPACIMALSLVNIALESGSSKLDKYPDLILVMQSEVCKHLLLLSTSTDLTILSLTLRVIFNLFNSIKGHLKVQLEVFITSVHLRILDNSSGISETMRELVLESLLEFCQEPALMQDIYVNYDCDVQCTNLFESICKALANQGTIIVNESFEDDESSVELAPISTLNRLSVECTLATIESIARGCKVPMSRPNYGDEKHGQTVFSPVFPRSSTSFLDESLSDTESEVDTGDRCPESQWNQQARDRAAQMLQERKKKKQQLALVAVAFNKEPFKKDWITYAESLNVLTSPATAESVANFLFSTPKLDKTQIGQYISRGPPEKYPFNATVLDRFTACFEFAGMSFSDALRSFLLRFRLPGEAQCIDRLMEAFSKRLYEACKEDELSPFKNSDAVFVLAFSTIMLNTDLHNPNMADEKRMTAEQFVRNNRGINDGEDLPSDFLLELYDQIRGEEIQVRQEITDSTSIDDLKWDVVTNKEVAQPFFTPALAARETFIQANLQEKDMFVSIFDAALESMTSVYQRTNDDLMVVKLFGGFFNMGQICVYFGLDEMLNRILVMLLEDGYGYIMDAFVEKMENRDDQGSYFEEDPPHDLIKEAGYDGGWADLSSDYVSGSAVHRGLISLYCAFTLSKFQASLIRESLPSLLDCLLALRDLDALPSGLSELDDFADSKGKILPASLFAQQSNARTKAYMKQIFGPEPRAEGFWSSLGGSKASKASLQHRNETLSNSLRLVSKVATFDKILFQRKDFTLALRVFRSLLDSADPDNVIDIPLQASPLLEHHGVFALELASRILMIHRNRAHEFYPVMFEKLRNVLTCKRSAEIPYLVERCVVTILRSCVHLFDVEEMRKGLLQSLELLLKISPDIFMHIADRFACGLAIVFRGFYVHLREEPEWSLMGKLLDIGASYRSGRGIIFDCLCACIEAESHCSAQNDNLGGFPFVGKVTLITLLSKFVSGDFEGDWLASIPAMSMLQRVYFSLDVEVRYSPELWGMIMNSFIKSSGIPSLVDSSIQGIEILLLHTGITEISSEIWLELYRSLLCMQFESPEGSLSEHPRNRSLFIGVLCRSLLCTLPFLCKDNQNIEPLTRIFHELSQSVNESLSKGDEGNTFEKTVQAVTNMVNVLSIPGFDDGVGFCEWGSKLLTKELEKFGAAGGIIPSQLMTTVTTDDDHHGNNNHDGVVDIVADTAHD